MILVVDPASNIHSVNELIAFCKANHRRSIQTSSETCRISPASCLRSGPASSDASALSGQSAGG